MVKHMSIQSIRFDMEMIKELEKIASEENSNFSEVARKLIGYGQKMYKIKGKIITPEGLEEMKKEVDEKIKDETFLKALDGLNFEQLGAIKTYLEMKDKLI